MPLLWQARLRAGLPVLATSHRARARFHQHGVEGAGFRCLRGQGEHFDAEGGKAIGLGKQRGWEWERGRERTIGQASPSYRIATFRPTFTIHSILLACSRTQIKRTVTGGGHLHSARSSVCRCNIVPVRRFGIWIGGREAWYQCSQHPYQRTVLGLSDLASPRDTIALACANSSGSEDRPSRDTASVEQAVLLDVFFAAFPVATFPLASPRLALLTLQLPIGDARRAPRSVCSSPL